MRTIIKGRSYDTETATLICEVGSTVRLRTDCGFWTGTLYRTPGGRYFVVGDGGAYSPFASLMFDGRTGGGEGLRIVDEADARMWAEHELDAEAYERAFGAVEPA